MAEKYSVILVGGGTGGHIMPLVAIGEELARQKVSFVYVGGKNSREEAIVKELKWPFMSIAAGKWRRYVTVQSIGNNIVDLFRIVTGIFQSISILKKTGAKVVFSKGGYIALPMTYACRLTGRKLLIHESDSVMGTTNRISAKWARSILTAFEPNAYPNNDHRFLQTGIPIRLALRNAATLKVPSKTRPLILVMGGIQGASAINDLIKETLSELLSTCDVIHSTGEADIEKYVKLRNALSKENKQHYKPFAFIDRELPYYFQSADLIVSRSSATTTAEGALFGKAMYLIPLPTSASNHQFINAKKLSEQGAAIMKVQSELTAKEFQKDVKELLSNKTALDSLGSNLKRYFNEEKSVQQIAAIISKQLDSGGTDD